MTPSSGVNRHRLYRSRRDHVFLGVCGGLAEHFDFSPGALRLLTALLIFFSGVFGGIIVYLIVGLVMKPAPEREFESLEEEDFYYAARQAPALAIDRVRRRFERLDERLQHMESIVTSRDFEVEQEFRKL
jgi:phage shock protein C